MNSKCTSENISISLLINRRTSRNIAILSTATITKMGKNQKIKKNVQIERISNIVATRKIACVHSSILQKI